MRIEVEREKQAVPSTHFSCGLTLRLSLSNWFNSCSILRQRERDVQLPFIWLTLICGFSLMFSLCSFYRRKHVYIKEYNHGYLDHFHQYCRNRLPLLRQFWLIWRFLSTRFPRKVVVSCCFVLKCFRAQEKIVHALWDFSFSINIFML